ncbi:MAG: tetratricopeptide repeat protein [Kosmotoga sp.]|nr:MAG: tetratricopeptide repeat protein [Kosmotoga sp.]
MGNNGEEGMDMKKLLLVILVFIFATFCFTQNDIEKTLNNKARNLLSKNYLETLDTHIEGNFEYTIAAIFEAVKYNENYNRVNKLNFYRYLEKIDKKELSDELAFSLEIAETVVSTSTVGALKKLNARDFDDPFTKALALRIFFKDWKSTGDPKTAKKSIQIAKELESVFPKAYYIFYVFLEYHSKSSFRNPEIFMEYRKKALELNLGSDVINEIIQGEYRLGKYEKVIEDYKRLENPDELSKFFQGFSYYILGDYGTAELRLKDTNLSEIPKNYASQAYDALGQIAEKEGNIDSAIFYYQKSLQNNPNNTDAMIHIGFAYLESDVDNNKTLARYYLEMSKMEEYRTDVKETLDRLRRDLVLSVIFKRILPLAVIIIVSLVLLEYYFKRKRKREEKEILDKDADNN